MIKKIIFFFSLVIFVSCFKIKTVHERYLDYIEQGLVSLYTGDKDYIKNFDKAYKLDKNDTLLYDIVNSQLDFENIKKFYENKKNSSNGYYDYFQSNLLKSYSLGNRDAAIELYNEYFYNFQYRKAYEILEKSKIPRVGDIYTKLMDNKDLFFDIEDIYNKMVNGKASKSEIEKFKNFVVKYPADIDKTYEVLRSEIEKEDKTALYIKYMSLDSESIVAIKLLEKLVDANFGPAINRYVIVNKITDPDNELLEKIDKYAKYAYVSLLNNCVEKGNISNIANIIPKIKDNKENSLALADFYYYYKDAKLAYNEYVKAYYYGANLDYVVYRLENIARKEGKEKEFLELVKDYRGENEFLVYKLKFDMSNNKYEKKEYALKIWATNPRLAASCFLDITKDKKKINCYTNILKIYK